MVSLWIAKYFVSRPTSSWFFAQYFFARDSAIAKESGRRRVSIDRQISILRRFELSARDEQQRGSDGAQVWRSHNVLEELPLASERSQHEEGCWLFDVQRLFISKCSYVD